MMKDIDSLKYNIIVTELNSERYVTSSYSSYTNEYEYSVHAYSAAVGLLACLDKQLDMILDYPDIERNLLSIALTEIKQNQISRDLINIPGDVLYLNKNAFIPSYPLFYTRQIFDYYDLLTNKK